MMTTKGTIEFDDGDIYSIVLDDEDSFKAIHHLWDMIDRDTPKKPKNVRRKDGDVEGLCPNCGTYVCWLVVESVLREETHFCNHCGQRIDWGA